MRHSNLRKGGTKSSFSGGNHGGGSNGSIFSRNKWYFVFIVIGAVITFINITAYLHYAAMGGGESLYDDGGDGDGLHEDPNSFLAAHRNKKISHHSSASSKIEVNKKREEELPPPPRQQSNKKEEATQEARAVQEENEVDNTEKKKRHRHHHGDKKNNAPDAKDPTTDEKEKKGRSHRSKKGAADSQNDAPLLSDLTNGHDRNEIQSVHHVELGDPANKKDYDVGRHHGKNKRQHRHHRQQQQEEGGGAAVADSVASSTQKEEDDERKNVKDVEATADDAKKSRRRNKRHRAGDSDSSNDKKKEGEDLSIKDDKESRDGKGKRHRKRRHHQKDRKEGDDQNVKDAAADENENAENQNEDNEAGREAGEAVDGDIQKNSDQNKNNNKPSTVDVGASNTTLFRDFLKNSINHFDAAVSAYKAGIKEKLSEEVEQSSNRFNDIVEAAGHGVLLPTGTRRDLEFRFGLSGMAAMPVSADKGAVGKGNPFVVGEEKDSSDDEAVRAADDEKMPATASAYCDPTNADFDAASDAACMRYLTDIRNMQSIKVMSSILSTGRTIKMKVYYRHSNIEAVLKVSQKKFALEPVSEVMAFHMDRVLGFNRVPPVVWTPIPLDFLRAAAAQHGPFYSQWLQKFAIDYETSKPLVTSCMKSSHQSNSNDYNDQNDGADSALLLPPPPHSGQCLNVSLQLWMFDVHDATETHISPPTKYRHLLNVPFKEDGAEDSGDGSGSQRHKSRRRGNKGKKFEEEGNDGNDNENKEGAGGEGGEDKSSSSSSSADGVKKMTAVEKSLRADKYLWIAASELMDQYVFDYIIGNSDRWFGHNSFALGAWVRAPADGDPIPTDPASGKILKASSIRTISTPRLAYIDQGSSFYGRSGPEMNPFTKNTGPFCRFKKRTVENILAVIPPSSSSSSGSKSEYMVARLVKDRLPRGVFHLSSPSLLKAAGVRADKIAAHMRECLANFSKADVMYF